MRLDVLEVLHIRSVESHIQRAKDEERAPSFKHQSLPPNEEILHSVNKPHCHAPQMLIELIRADLT
jgi:hypothetical protein